MGMIYLFSSRDENHDLVFDGFVAVTEGGDGEAEVTQEQAIDVDQEKFEDFLNNFLYEQEFPHRAMILGEDEGNTSFNKNSMEHWHILPDILRTSAGYGGVEEYTDEEFEKLAEEVEASETD